MSSHIRSRSVSRSRAVKNSDLFPSGKSLDPLVLLADVLDNFKSLDIPLAVNISDGENEVSYLLSVFISKEYEVVEDKVKFGFKKLNVSHLRASISFEISIERDDEQS
jgi:hypothetical protein